MTNRASRIVVSFAVLVAVCAVAPADAGVYPTNKCISKKLKAAALKCKDDLHAWSRWDRTGDTVKRDAELAKSTQKFTDRWAKAEAKALAKDVDCGVTTLPAAAMATLIDDAVENGADGIVDAINDGLDLGDGNNARCGGGLLKAAATKCRGLLGAESKFIKKLDRDPERFKLTERRAKIDEKYRQRWDRTIFKYFQECPTTATKEGVELQVDTLVDDVVFNSVTSPPLASVNGGPSDPAVDQGWFEISPGPAGTLIEYEGVKRQPICSRGTDYVFFARRGTVNNLVIYYEGGGACWNNLSCSGTVPAFKETAESSNNPGLITTGFADLSNPANPFKDWNQVFVTYCTGDIHTGRRLRQYNFGGTFPIFHFGYDNAKVVEKFAREHFPNPDRIMVTGSSAGAGGALFWGGVHPAAWPASEFFVLGDALAGVATQATLAGSIVPNWGIANNLPDFQADVPVTATFFGDLLIEQALFYPRHRIGQYTTAYDFVQTTFYNFMVQPDPIVGFLEWWLSTCDFAAQARALSLAEVAAASNVRYYFGAGSDHTIYGNPKAYTDTKGGVQTFVSWVDDMLNADDADWNNNDCTGVDCNLLPGDPEPSPPDEDPFDGAGNVVCP